MKKLYIILSVLLLSLFWLVGTCSYASINYTNFTQWNYNGSKIDLTNQLFTNFLGVSYDDYGDYMNQNDSSYTRFNTFKTRLEGSNYQAFFWYDVKNTNYLNDTTLNIHLSVNDNFSSTTARYQFYKQKNGSYYNCVLSSTSSSESVNGTLSNDAGRNKYLLTGSSWYIANNSPYTPPQLTMSFIPLSSVIKNIGGINFYIQNFTRYETFFKIGQIGNFDFREQYRGICAMLVNGVYQNSDIQLYINPNGEVFVYTSNLLFNQGYGFKFFNNDLETDIYNFYFIPNGSTSGDINSSGDYVYNGFDNNDIVPIANLINDQYSVNSGEMSAYIDSLFPSGDLSPIAAAYDFDSFENNYFNYLYGFFTNIINTLTSEGDVTLPITYRSFSYNLKSSDFYVPNSPLKTLVTTILIVFCFFLVYQQLDKMFKHIRELNIFAFLHDTDVDYHMFL